MYGTATPPASQDDNKVNTIPYKTGMTTDEFQHNSVDIETPTEFWNVEGEVKIFKYSTLNCKIFTNVYICFRLEKIP